MAAKKEHDIDSRARIGARASVLITLVGALVGISAQAAPPGRTIMATKSVAKYLGVERSLLQALATHDEKAADAMLDDNFEQKTPIREEAKLLEVWLADELKKPHEGERVRDLSVLEEGDVAIVSFLLESPPPKTGKAKTPSYFIVDVWQQSSGKLMARYMDMPSNAPPFHAGPNTRE
jgi:hypothetical protein